MLRRWILILLIVVGLIFIVADLWSPERLLKYQLKQDTELTIPDNYSIIKRTGYFKKDSIHFEFGFKNEDLNVLVDSIRQTNFFNDTLVIKELWDMKWDPEDPKKTWKKKGFWIETDTSFFFMNSPVSYVGKEPTYTTEASLDKRSSILTVTIEF